MEYLGDGFEGTVVGTECDIIYQKSVGHLGRFHVLEQDVSSLESSHILRFLIYLGTERVL